MSNDVEARPKLGISSCLLGNEVRYDGGHKHNAYITRTLGEYFDFFPFCPEVAIGQSTPRPPIRLIDDGESVRVLGTDDSSLDYTAKLRGYGDRVSGSMDDYCGYIVKKDSPSCGMERVKIYQDTKEVPPVRRGSGAPDGPGAKRKFCYSRIHVVPLALHGKGRSHAGIVSRIPHTTQVSDTGAS